MTQQFKDQGGAATMDPSALRRWLLSKYVSFRSSEGQLHKQRQKAERRRRADARPHVVEYFHQVDDGYSHLAAQLLQPLAERYGVEVRCHLVRGPEGKNVSDPDLLLRLARYDSSLIASHYGLSFPVARDAPAGQAVELALSVLASLDATTLVQELAAVSDAFWSGDIARLEQLASGARRAEPAEVAGRLEAGTNRRAELKHYSGAMFHYEGEWYWGVDRLHYLEERLAALGL
ncbi:MAG: 2-hydroxychromene-2-carboxylate isomerase, partial [Pseudomonadota bacterium]